MLVIIIAFCQGFKSNAEKSACFDAGGLFVGIKVIPPRSTTALELQ